MEPQKATSSPLVSAGRALRGCENGKEFVRLSKGDREGSLGNNAGLAQEFHPEDGLIDLFNDDS